MRPSSLTVTGPRASLGLALLLSACINTSGQPRSEPGFTPTDPLLTAGLNIEVDTHSLTFEHVIGVTGCAQLVGQVTIFNPKSDKAVRFRIENASTASAVAPDVSSGELGPRQSRTVRFSYDCTDITPSYTQRFRIVPFDATGDLPGATEVTISGSIHLPR